VFHSIGERLGNLILESAVGVVVVDQEYDIQIINPAAIRLLGIYTAAISKDLIHLVETVPATGLRAAIDAAFQRPPSRHDESGANVTVVTVETALGELRRLQIACYPHTGNNNSDMAGVPGANLHGVKPHTERVLILVSDVTRQIQEQAAAVAAAAETNVRHQAVGPLAKADEPDERERAYLAIVEENAQLRARVEEISAVNRRLLHDSQELVEANLELRGANEDLLVGREEAEANAEEVKTLNEELQATNEELVTVNEEMEATVEELHTANDDLAARSRELQQLAAMLKAQHQASEAARAQLEAILLSMGDALLVVDAHGARILTNTAYTRMFDGEDGELVAEDAQGQPLPADMQPQHQAATGSPFTLAFMLTAADGTRRWFEATGQPVRHRGIEGGVVSIRDITERRLRLLQEEFLALASHELRSPLTALLMALQLLTRRSLSDMAGADTQRTLRLALRQAQRLRVLVNDLLDASRVQQGKLHLQLAPVDLVALVSEAVEAVRLDVQSQAINLDRGTEPLVVMADAPRLEQVILNLLTNAIKFAPDTQRIDVRLRRAEAMSGTGHAEAILQVQDYGPGISAAELPQVFTRYFQSAHTTAHGGLGLGLFITRELVTAHDGDVSVVSTEGQGATFTVRLPLIEGAQDAQGDLGAATLPPDPTSHSDTF
jgi:two-component system CheB/CheR fusion protein